MTFLAATATATTHLQAILAGALIVLTLGYALACWLWPFGYHRWCRGTGRTGPKLRQPCRGCRGTGRKLRIGRRIYNAVDELRRDGTR